jgi:hypothetical protein
LKKPSLPISARLPDCGQDCEFTVYQVDVCRSVEMAGN